jgi:hypothetical protein
MRLSRKTRKARKRLVFKIYRSVTAQQSCNQMGCHPKLSAAKGRISLVNEILRFAQDDTQKVAKKTRIHTFVDTEKMS